MALSSTYSTSSSPASVSLLLRRPVSVVILRRLENNLFFFDLALLHTTVGWLVPPFLVHLRNRMAGFQNPSTPISDSQAVEAGISCKFGHNALPFQSKKALTTHSFLPIWDPTKSLNKKPLRQTCLANCLCLADDIATRYGVNMTASGVPGGPSLVTKCIQAPVDDNTAMNKPFTVQSMLPLQSPFL